MQDSGAPIGTNVVCHVANDKASEIQKDRLQVDEGACVGVFEQLGAHAIIGLGKDMVDQDLQIGAAEELEAGPPLGFPKLAGSIDDSTT